ncbi:MAG TPA: DoxX family protein [Isosphaeraceae bacterium]|nr:DoxX family protein [Isosphaeraceae bacterium]
MSLQPVDTVSAVVLIVTIVANMGIALADFSSAKFVLNNSAQVGVSTRWLPMLGALKAAGAVGLLLGLGLLGVRPIGIAAALGLVMVFIGAVATHVRARVFYNIAFPMGYLALAVASLAVLL